MLRIDEPNESHVRYVAEHMRRTDVDEFLAVSFAEDRQQLTEIMVAQYAAHPAALCASDEFGPVAVGAMIEARPNVITLMFFATDRFVEIALPLTRFIRQRLFPRYRDAGVHRIECISIEGHYDAHRWLNTLGLSHEARLRGFGKDGEHFHQFAWVADDAR